MVVSLVLMAMIWTMPALAWNEPLGFQDFPWGSSERTVKSRVEIIYCVDLSPISAAHRGYRSCTAPFAIGSVQTEATFTFRDGGLVSVDLHFGPGDFEAIKGILLDRYGQPSLEQPARLFWKGKLTSIILYRSRDRPEKAVALFVEAKEEKALLERNP